MQPVQIRPGYDCDVLVAGGGPAGASAAIHLARAELNVILLDRQQFPRDKVCGDFVGPAALLELQELGISGRKDYRSSNIIRQAALYLDGEELIVQSIPRVEGLPDNGRVIPRLFLDNWVFEAAKGAGVRTLEKHKVVGFERDASGVQVEVRCPSGVRQFYTRLLIGADGSSSRISRLLRGSAIPHQNLIVGVRAYFEGVSGPADQADLYFSGDSFPGYYWLFPTGPNSANVGIGMVLKTVPPVEDPLRELLLDLIEKDTALCKRLRNATMQGKILGWPLNTYNPDLNIADERVMLIGDAAGLINPLNGEGIQYALLSGKWAAQVAARCAEMNDFSKKALQPYTQMIEDYLGYDMALAGLIVQFIRNRSLNPVWLQALHIIVERARLDPDYARTAGGILAGMLPASNVINLKFLLGTLEQAAVSLGVESVLHALRSPGCLVRAGMDGLKIGINLATESIQDPLALAKWGMGLTKSTAELLGEAAKHILLPPKGRK